FSRPVCQFVTIRVHNAQGEIGGGVKQLPDRGERRLAIFFAVRPEIRLVQGDEFAALERAVPRQPVLVLQRTGGGTGSRDSAPGVRRRWSGHRRRRLRQRLIEVFGDSTALVGLKSRQVAFDIVEQVHRAQPSLPLCQVLAGIVL